MVSRPEEWPWNSYRAMSGEEEAPPFLETDRLLRVFADSRQQAAAGYRRFVAEGANAPSPWLDLKNQVYLGSERFVERMQALIDPSRPLGEIPKRQRRPVDKPLDYYAAHYGGRDRAMAEAYRSDAYSMQAIGEYFRVSRMTVSRAVKRFETECASQDVHQHPDRSPS